MRPSSVSTRSTGAAILLGIPPDRPSPIKAVKAQMLANEESQRAVEDSTKLGRTLGFLRLLLAVDHALDSRSKRMQMRLGITAPQRFFLRIVGRFPGISAGEVASIMEVHPSTLTGVLRRLQERRWVNREDDKADRRRSLLKLTPEGKRYDELRTGTAESAVKRALQRVSAEDADAAARVLSAVIAELQRED